MNEKERASGLASTPGYRYADRVGDRLFLAGQVPHDGAGQLIGKGDVKVQARQCLRNLHAVVDANGFSPADIHQLTIYVAGDRADLSSAWQEIKASFDSNVPPATLLGVTILGSPDQLVEIDARVER